MTRGKFVAYYRVSTQKQGNSGLGLDAQKAAVMDWLNGGSWQLVGEFTEIESGKRDDRIELAKAMNLCRLTGASLVIAKLDRLSRNAEFLLSLERSGIEFVAVDMPNANRLTIGIMALVADEERRMIAARTKAALAAARERGVKLGGFRGYMFEPGVGAEANRKKAEAFAARLAPMLSAMRARGLSLRAIAAEMNEQGVLSPRGCRWSAATVRQAIIRLGREEPAAIPDAA